MGSYRQCVYLYGVGVNLQLGYDVATNIAQHVDEELSPVKQEVHVVRVGTQVSDEPGSSRVQRLGAQPVRIDY